MKTTIEKYTAKAAASLEKMTERTACAGYCNTASGMLFTDKEGRALYTLPGYSVTREQMPNGCREMPALEKLYNDFSALHSVPAEKAATGTLADGKKGLAVIRFYAEDGRHATVNKKLLSYFPAEAVYRVTSDRKPVLVYDGEDMENLLGAALPILCTRGGSDSFRPTEEKPAEEKPRRLSRLAKIEPAAEEKPEAVPAAEPEAENIPAADIPAEAPEKAAEAAEEPKAEETPAESAATTAAEEAETAALAPFFFPAPVADQLGSLPVGEVVTVYRADEWTLQNTAFCGILIAADPGNYAQYSGVYLTIKRGRKDVRIFCRDGLETVIFSGLPYSLPDPVKYASVKASGGATIAECRSQGDEMRQIIRFYAEMGRKPIFDTVQR